MSRHQEPITIYNESTPMITPHLKQSKQDTEVFQSNNDLIWKGLNKSL